MYSFVENKISLPKKSTTEDHNLKGMVNRNEEYDGHRKAC